MWEGESKGEFWVDGGGWERTRRFPAGTHRLFVRSATAMLPVDGIRAQPHGPLKRAFVPVASTQPAVPESPASVVTTPEV